MFWVANTTITLVIVTFMAVMNFSFNWVFYATVIGQLMIVYMVHKVLIDNFVTEKTFKDFYEDHPIGHF